MNSVKSVDIDRIRATAEDYYRKGEFYCSEAIIKTIIDEFKVEIPQEAVAMASGFPVGLGGAGCLCGAISGGIMAIGLFFGRCKAGDPRVSKAMELSIELYDYFKQRHSSLCCRVLTKDMKLGSPDHMKQCIAFTGEVAAEAAKIIVREMNKESA